MRNWSVTTKAALTAIMDGIAEGVLTSERDVELAARLFGDTVTWDGPAERPEQTLCMEDMLPITSAGLMTEEQAARLTEAMVDYAEGYLKDHLLCEEPSIIPILCILFGRELPRTK